MNKRPFLSVLMPVYNAADFLAASVDSVLASDVEDLELICVDDGSDDASVQLIQTYTAKDSRVRLFTQAHAGVAVARNEALMRAAGQYITFVDCDDVVTPSFFRELLEAAQRTGAECVIAGWTVVSSGVVTPKPLVTSSSRRYRVTPAVLSKLPKNSWGCVYARALLERSCAHFPPGVSYGEDMVFNYCVWSNCSSIVLLPSVGYHYRLREGSLSVAVSDTVADLMKGGEFLLDYWKRRCMLTEDNRENLLCFLVHSLRRARSYGSRELVERFEQWINVMVEKAGIEISDLDCLRNKDARALWSILRGASTIRLGDRWRRVSRWVRHFFHKGALKS